MVSILAVAVLAATLRVMDPISAQNKYLYGLQVVVPGWLFDISSLIKHTYITGAISITGKSKKIILGSRYYIKLNFIYKISVQSETCYI